MGQIKYLDMSADDLKAIKWYMDPSFVVRPNFKSHTGAIMNMGQVSMKSVSRK